ncbi:MAG: D-tyrosyl-tRNA(Tyr) deacylase, partial [Flavobacteriales bacterium]|nr:D-tyrosyl-tRNA(Tyr) deacylase [Flavobacteriales bacterium]
MRAVVQRVKRASVTADGVLTASIGVGLMVLVGIVEEDTLSDADWLAGKIVRMRIFDDEAGVMNRSVADVGGDVTIVSQFTLHALTARGNRPSYIRAARRDVAIPLYEYFLKAVEK